jgi:hypothetical protein
MDNEKEPVVPVPAGVLAALLAACTFANCKTINHKEMLEIISNQAEEVEEGLSGTISMLSLAHAAVRIWPELDKSPRCRNEN